MIDARHRWVFPEPLHLDPEVRAAARALGLGTFAATVLARRGIADPAAMARFLGPAEDGLNDPHLLPDADRLVERIRRAVDGHERVMVFGDFDADGLTGLAQLVLAFRRLGLDAVPYVPSRLEEGHGLSTAAVETAARDGIALIVTVDTGSTSVAEIADAAARGIDVIITDHHHLPEVLPAAVAIVNPQRADSAYPDRRLSGSGVAFTVARLLLGELAGAEAEARELADLATIGTVSDVVPVLGENRSIAQLGLERMRTAPRPGIAALLAKAGVAPATVDLETVGFVLAPTAQRRRPRGRGPRRRPAPARRHAGGGDHPGRGPRGGQPHPPRPHAQRRGRGSNGVRPAGPGAGTGPAGVDRRARVRPTRGSASRAAPTPPRSSRPARGPSASSASSRDASPTRRDAPRSSARSSGRPAATWSAPRAGATAA